MPLNIIRNDITKMNVDAIVNAANTDLSAGGGVCGAIFTAAGVEKLQAACEKLAPIETGEAVITKGYSLPAKFVVHTAGPIYKDGNQNEEALLRSCYIKSLDIAKKHGCDSIAFPLISSGIYGYPKDKALGVATSTISEWLMDNDMEVSLVVFDKAAFMLSGELQGDVKSFIDQNYVDERDRRFARRRYQPAEEIETFDGVDLCAEPLSTVASVVGYTPSSKENIIANLDEPFSATLLKIIDSKGKTDVEVYKRANLDRKHFSKIRKGKGYMPSKKTVVALAVALELSLTETRNLLERAGFALSRSVVFDVIIEYFIVNKKYNIFDINNVLFEYDQPLLGG